MMPDFAGEQSHCPVIAHIGDNDNTMSQQRIDFFHRAQPAIPIYMYAGAGHGFDNPSRVERYHAEGCRLARQRTLEFLARHINHDG
jgi:carboxymethylenebutenolidase